MTAQLSTGANPRPPRIARRTFMSKRAGYVAAGVLAAASIFAGFDAWADIWFVATRDEEQSHILLAPIVAVWMAVVRRVRLRKLAPQGSVAGLALIVIGALASHLGFRNGVDVAWHAGAVLMLMGSIIAITGRHFAFAFLPAFFVLVFMVPAPGGVRQGLSLPLQTATAYCTQIALEVFGIDVERSGNVLVVNGSQIAVAEACNGMRMVWALVLVAYAFAMSIPLRNGVRMIVVCMSPILALLCNVVRLVPTALLYGFGDQGVADTFHDVSGWLMIPIAFIALLVVVRVFRWAAIPVTRFNLAYQ